MGCGASSGNNGGFYKPLDEMSKEELIVMVKDFRDNKGGGANKTVAPVNTINVVQSPKSTGNTIPKDDEGLRAMAREIFAAGCEAANPSVAARRSMLLDGNFLRIGRDVGDGLGGTPTASLDMNLFKKVFVIGIGKACVRMAEGIEHVLGRKIDQGLLITKYDHSKDHALSQKFKIFEAAHPKPDAAGVTGTNALCELLESVDAETLVICIITGGGTALLTAPQEPLTLDEYIECNGVLLGCGCPIEEKNAVLKHLDRLKGGQLARACEPATLVSMLISDVVGDPLDVIASGPTVPDESTFKYCMEVVERYDLRQKLPAAALKILEEGVAGKRQETPKAGSSAFAKGVVHIGASNEVAVNACIKKAETIGFNTLALSSAMEGEAVELAKAYVGISKEIVKNNRPVRVPAMVIGGGETTVTLPDNPGLGGRSQALSLSALRAIDGMERVAILAGGTDGGDGPCDAGGAVVCGSDAAAARQHKLSVDDFLKRSDSYNFYMELDKRRYGKSNVMHLRDGPTGTNVMDIVLVLVV